MNKILREIPFSHILICVLSFTLFSCEKEETSHGNSVYMHKSPNLINGYVFPDTMEIRYDGVDTLSNAKFRLYNKGFIASRVLADYESWKYANIQERLIDRKDYDRSIELFDSLSIVYHDTNYNDRTPLGYNWALAYSVDSISIVSDADYDDSHKAGNNLADITNIVTGSYYNCIANGYKSKDIYIGKKVSELSETDRILMQTRNGGLYNLMAEFSIPQSKRPKEQHITVTYHFSNKKNLSATAKVQL